MKMTSLEPLQAVVMKQLVPHPPQFETEDRVRPGDDRSTAPANMPVIAGTEATLSSGHLARGEVAEILGTSDRHARGVLVSQSPRAPRHIAFPAILASRWMPGLFPEQP